MIRQRSLARAAALFLALGFLANRPALAEDAPQQVGAAKPDAASVLAWRQDLNEWRRWFLSEKLDPERSPDLAREKIEAIDDPAAVPALIAMLKTEKNARLRLVLVKPLVTIGGKDAVAFLVKLSVEDENPLLREEVSKGLAGNQELPPFLNTYLAYLKSPKSVENAAEALLWTKLIQPVSPGEKPDPKITTALINALNTVQEQIIPYKVAYDTGLLVGPKGPHTTAGFRTARAWGTREGMVKVRIPVPQPKVLTALQGYTGQDYQYADSEWKQWLQKRSSE